MDLRDLFYKDLYKNLISNIFFKTIVISESFEKGNHEVTINTQKPQGCGVKV